MWPDCVSVHVYECARTCVVESARETIKQGKGDVGTRAEVGCCLNCTCWRGFHEMVTFERDLREVRT